MGIIDSVSKMKEEYRSITEKSSLQNLEDTNYLKTYVGTKRALMNQNIDNVLNQATPRKK